MRPVPVTLGLAVAATTLLGGCAGPVPQRPGAVAAGSQGGAWEAVFSTPEFAADLAQSDPRARPEFARSDARLAVADARPLLATEQWPTEPRPDLRYSRRITIADTERTAVFYFPGSRYRASPERRVPYDTPSPYYIFPR